MRRYFFILVGLLMAMIGNAKTLSAPMREFIELCIREREIVLQENSSYDKQYKQLFELREEFLHLSAKESAICIHPHNEYSASDFRGHILFSPTYISRKLDAIDDEPDVTPPYADDYHKGESDEDSEICYFNSLVSSSNPDTLSYYPSQTDEQQIVVIGENNTPLEIEIVSGSKKSTIQTDPDSGIAVYVWKEEDLESAISVSVKTKSDKKVSFVIAVY